MVSSQPNPIGLDSCRIPKKFFDFFWKQMIIHHTQQIQHGFRNYKTRKMVVAATRIQLVSMQGRWFNICHQAIEVQVKNILP